MKRLLSLVIISLFSGLIFSGAAFTLKVVSEDETNMSYISSAFDTRNKMLGASIGTKEVQNVVDAAENLCTNEKANDMPISNSIVDYLHTRGKDYEFSQRAQLAAKHGINNYNGNKEQNKLLITKLIEESDKCN